MSKDFRGASGQEQSRERTKQGEKSYGIGMLYLLYVHMHLSLFKQMLC